MLEKINTDNLTLMETMAAYLHCTYISDLKYLNEKQRKSLAQLLGRMPANDCRIQEWNDAIEYLAGGKKQYQEVELAKKALISFLSVKKTIHPIRILKV